MNNFDVRKCVSNSRNLLAGSTAVLLETLFWDRSRAKHWFKHFSTLKVCKSQKQNTKFSHRSKTKEIFVWVRIRQIFRSLLGWRENLLCCFWDLLTFKTIFSHNSQNNAKNLLLWVPQELEELEFHVDCCVRKSVPGYGWFSRNHHREFQMLLWASPWLVQVFWPKTKMKFKNKTKGFSVST